MTIGKFVVKMYETNARFFDIQSMLYKSYQVRYLTEIQQSILEVVKIENEMSNSMAEVSPENAGNINNEAQKLNRLKKMKTNRIQSEMEQKMKHLVKSYKNRASIIVMNK